MIELNLQTIYYNKENPILNNVSFNMKQGEIVALTGPSGIGKSTILKIIAGLHSGYDGSLVMPENMRIAFISQNKCLLPWKTVYQNLVLLRKIETGVVDRESAEQLIHALGLTGFEKKYPFVLSGGQYQRVSLGQAFYYKPDILLMDEPFSALDSKTKKEIQDVFLTLKNQYPITTLFVTHNVEEATYMGSRIINLE
ncbi:MAG: Taurine-transporting ATPase [Anaerocolumna sp.]|jgi:NitT/TauT family transport system ATP-binding protein|nr:Taurine-transporting ATPase [Anaerocolumna sp.]